MSSASPITTQSVSHLPVCDWHAWIVAFVQVSAVGWVFAHRFQNLAAKAVAPAGKKCGPKTAAAKVEDDEEKICRKIRLESNRHDRSIRPIDLATVKPEPFRRRN
jgi:hypothetical protein